MPTVEIGRFENSFVIHFGSELPRINAYTLASTIVAIADAAKAANATINPGYEIEVVVEALGDGSFKATVRAIYRSLENLFSADPIKSIVLGIIATVIYEHTLAPHPNVIVNVDRDEVVIEEGDTRIVVPRTVYESIPAAERSPGFRKGIADAVRAVESDSEIRTLSLNTEHGELPSVEIPRDRFALLTQPPDEGEPHVRDLVEITDLQIVRAILERSQRKWQFVWNGVRISAPVLDTGFYDRFFAHAITIAPGDVLRAKLRVHQRRHPDLGIFVNEEYEVLEVLDHIPRPRQQWLLGDRH